MTRVSRILKDYQEAGALHALVPIEAAVDERTFLTKGGHVLNVLKTDGIDYECLDPEQLDQIARRFEGTLRLLDERFRVYQYVFKRSHPAISVQHYPNPVLEQAIAGRTAYLKERAGTLFSLEIYFVIVYAGRSSSDGWRRRLSDFAADPKTALRQGLSYADRLAHLEDDVDRASNVLREKVDSLVVQFRDVLSLSILDTQQAFRFFRRLLNYSPFKADAGGLKYTSHVDFQACDSALECHRDHLRVDAHYVKVLTLKEPPARTFAHLLRQLQEIPANFIIATEWKRETNATVRRLIQSKRRHFHNSKSSMMNYLTSTGQTRPTDQLVDDSAVALVGDLGACLEELEINGRYFGQFSMTVVLYDVDWATVQRAAAECFKVFATHDARLIDERYNLLNAWLAVLPGNDAYNLRRLWLLNTNYADLSFLFGQRSGEPVNAHLGAEYLAVLETEVGTPYFLNLHFQDTAHSMVLGATGSGKSFLLNFLITYLQKYAPLTFIFDLGGSYESLTKLFRGAYAPILSENGRFSINPFCLAPTPENSQFLRSFLRVLIESGGYAMTSADERDVAEQIENVYAVEPDQRRLLTLSNILNRNLRVHLQKWVQGGAYGAWFDNTTDTVTLAQFQAFDFEGMGTYPQVIEPLVFYILHRANAAIYDASLARRFKVFVLDEAWRFFRHPAIKLYIIEALKTWRKKNAAMILVTQSLDDLRQSDLLPVIAESCATKLFLANPGMDRDAYREIFHLNHTETERIATLIPKQQILIKRPDLAKVLNLNVDPKSYWLFTNNPTDNHPKREAFERHGLEEGLEILARSHP